MAQRLVAIALSLSAGACATHPLSNVSEFAHRTDRNSFEIMDGGLTPAETLVLPVVHDRQTQGPSCGAHVLASIINYWQRSTAVTGDGIFAASPPASPSGYSMAELVSLAQARGLLASAVRLPEDGVITELEHGRPVLVPVRLPSVYIQSRSLPGENMPLVGLVRNSLLDRAGRISEFGHIAMADHYILVVGHEADTLVVVEPILGYRTISSEKLERYRRAFGDAAIVFSG